MKKQITRVTTVAVSAAMIAAALAFAAPAGARDTYSPALAPKAKSTAKVAVASIATFRPAAAVKRATRIKTAKAPTTRRTTAAASTSTPTSAGTSELSQARAILAGLVAQHPILKGATVEFGDARGYQAVAYYRSGRIVISKGHTASLKRILNHEVWHIIDYRDNGRIDWGENVPPR